MKGGLPHLKKIKKLVKQYREGRKRMKQKGGNFKGKNRQTSKQKGGFKMTQEDLKKILLKKKGKKNTANG